MYAESVETTQVFFGYDTKTLWYIKHCLSNSCLRKIKTRKADLEMNDEELYVANMSPVVRGTLTKDLLAIKRLVLLINQKDWNRNS